MLKVLHINDYPAESGGGAEVVMRQTLALLLRHGSATATFTSADLPAQQLTPLAYLHNSIARRALKKMLRDFRPDVVHLHNFYHVLSPSILTALSAYKRRHPLRVVMTTHDYHLVCPNAGGSWFRWWSGQREAIGERPFALGDTLARCWDERTLAHSLLKTAQHVWNYRWHDRRHVIDLLICPSRFVQQMMASLGLATCVLPHPCVPLQAHRRRSAQPLRFVFAGRLEPEKGLLELLSAWPTEMDATLTIIGAGSQQESCEAMSRVRGLAVEFTGRLPHAETLARIAEAHVLVQPSRVLETYGLTLIEALANGTNILAVQRGAAREIVGDTGVGYLYDADNPRRLLDQLQAIQNAHRAGTLNRFDISNFLADRGEDHYLARLLHLYGSAAHVGLLAA